MKDLRLPVRRTLPPKKSAYLLMPIVLCTHFYTTFTLTSGIFPFHQCCSCKVIDNHLYIGIEHIPLNHTLIGQTLNFIWEDLFSRRLWFISLCSAKPGSQQEAAELQKHFCISFQLQKMLCRSLIKVLLLLVIRAQCLSTPLPCV